MSVAFSAIILGARQEGSVCFFDLQVTPHLLGDRRPESWILARRYSQFDRLKEALEAQKVEISSFPRKHLVRSNTEAVVNRRIVDLNLFIEEVLLKNLDKQAVADFLELDAHSVQRHTSESLPELCPHLQQAFGCPGPPECMRVSPANVTQP
eukprot:TRINITY_DN10574_c0_g1_i2.p1 TRINITY_DN10574_c0_g1~~TRINITY_DN10574_c0_g1_i2.p1  ORF type:complete len:152 (+),score=41.67 TRINITY_DN10574_c0_g1_i2:179-634(+)